jgi:hypothetical protein
VDSKQQAQDWIVQALSDYAKTMPKSAGKAIYLLAQQAIDLAFDKTEEGDK